MPAINFFLWLVTCSVRDSNNSITLSSSNFWVCRFACVCIVFVPYRKYSSFSRPLVQFSVTRPFAWNCALAHGSSTRVYQASQSCVARVAFSFRRAKLSSSSRFTSSRRRLGPHSSWGSCTPSSINNYWAKFEDTHEKLFLAKDQAIFEHAYAKEHVYEKFLIHYTSALAFLVQTSIKGDSS